MERRSFLKVLGPVGLWAATTQKGLAQVFKTTDFPRSPEPTEPTSPQDHAFVGMWVTEDRRVRHHLLSNGRYNEARGTRESAYQGRYMVTGHFIEYWDDTGFYADGEFRDDVLYHGGMILYRQLKEKTE